MKLDNGNYDTYAEAYEELQIKKTAALERIRISGDVVEKDTSMVFNWNCVRGGKGYQARLLLWTKSLREDLEEMHRWP